MKKLFLLMLCLLLLLLSSCQLHIDTDPWPASPDYATVDETPAPTVTPDIQAPTDQPYEMMVTPTPQPSNDEVKPGLNG